MKKKKLTLTRTTITALSSARLHHVRGGGGAEYGTDDERSGTCAGAHSEKGPTTIIINCGDPSQGVCETPL